MLEILNSILPQVIYAIVLMLCGILAYETVKVSVSHLRDYRIKRECDKIEDREFKTGLGKALEKALKELEKED